MEFYRTESRTLPTVTAETPFEGSVTLYLRAGAPTAARDQQADARARVEALAEAGILLDPTISEWPSKAVVPSDGPAESGVETYDEFSEAIAPRPEIQIDPFFEDRSGIGRAERLIVLPVVCLAIRRGSDLTGLYPCWNDGHHDAVEDGLAALEAGKNAENLK